MTSARLNFELTSLKPRQRRKPAMSEDRENRYGKVLLVIFFGPEKQKTFSVFNDNQIKNEKFLGGEVEISSHPFRID